MSFQFVRIELFSRKGKEGRGTRFVFDEVARVPSASIHVAEPGTPIVVHGLTPDTLRSLHDERATDARTEVKGGKVRAIRQDQNTLAGIVLSYPVPMEEYRAKPEVVARVLEWERRSIAWLRGQFGGRLVSVVRHEDESHPHLHAYVLPDDAAMTAAHLHPGFRAKAAAKAAGAQPGEDDKGVGKRADAAYKAAMRAWLDDYHANVAQPCGMTRLGPGKRRLTREQWQAEKRQAEALRETLAKAEVLKAKGDAFIVTTKEKADRIAQEAAAARADAAKAIDAAQAAMVAARAAADVARQREETARRATERAARDTRAAKRLSGLGGLLRGLWDGLRKSVVAARIRKAVESEVDELRKQAAAAAERASAADAGRREAETRARNLRDNLMDTGRQLADVRQELAALRPRELAQSSALTPRP
ncbi:plasmid recombination protein [Agrobacterium pusense]|uniref:plasmid recombination protein n=1 Tax=Agrobacterium pusense TaxID=648995 RepID=UPI000D19C467|nr:plasmid recombination protein [Agrobacterium pusense]